MSSIRAHPLCTLAIAAGLVALAATAAPAQLAGGYGDYVDWKGWARVAPAERGGLASSWDPAGGMLDYNHYEHPPGQIWGNLDVTAATIRGPGILYRFWMPHFTATQEFAVRMYFDGEATPRLDTTSDQILEGEFGYFAAPLVTTFAGGQVCYEPIAFRDSVRIDTENQSGIQHYYQYSYRTFPPGTDLSSWDGSLDPAASSARLTTIAMFQNAGEHPARQSQVAVRTVVGPTSVPAGGTLSLASLTGPGLIRRLNVRLHGATDHHLDQMRLRVFWDAEPLPAIDVPVGWFFGAGHNRAPYRSLPIGTDSPDGFYCYWPMPFRQQARLELMNPTSGAIPIDSTVVEHEPGVQDTTLGYLHAVARSEVRALGSTWFRMVETFGTGHYVGNFLFLEQDYDDDFMLEGDEMIVVDLADTINGTGVEDAYNGGYYYNWIANPMPEPEGPSPPFAIRPLHGVLRREKRPSPPFARADQYRWMIADRVPFASSFEMSIENSCARVGSRWTSVVFFYQLPEPVSALPPPLEPDDRARGPELRSIEPNPAKDAMQIRFALPVDGPVSIELFDVTGRRVAVLGEGFRASGPHTISWRRGRLPDGVYLVRLQAGDFTTIRKLVLRR